MRDDLAQFENRSDDWLAKQRKHEEEVSVWDFDEAKKIKQEHHAKHLAYDQKVQSQKRSQASDEQLKKLSKIMPLISFGIFLLLFIISMFGF